MKIHETSVIGMTVGQITKGRDGSVTGPTDSWQLVALHEILQELKKLNAVLACPRFMGIPTQLGKIETNTRKPKRKAVKR